MNFFLNVALPSLDVHLVKKWVPGKSTHFDYFKGFNGSYAYEIAFALNLVSKFSDPDNILYNCGIHDHDGNLQPKNSHAPAKKRRKKTQTKAQAKEIEIDYYRNVQRVRQEMEKEGFVDRMSYWDRKLCDDRNKLEEGTTTAATRKSIMDPSMNNNCTDNSNTFLAAFFRTSNLFNNKRDYESMSGSDSSSTDSSPPHVVLTQPTPQHGMTAV